MRNTPHRFQLFRREIIDSVDGTPVYASVSRGFTYGIFGVLDTKEIAEWQGQNIEASVRVPHGTEVATTDTVRVITPRDAQAVGGWKVSTVRWNPLHLRLMLSRTSS